MHGMFHPQSSTARLYTSRKEGGRGLHSIENVVHQEEQSLRPYVSRKAENDPLMAECKRLIATWKEPDEAASWYEKPLHGASHKGVSEVADMTPTYQLLHKSNIKANPEALIMAAQERPSTPGSGTRDLPHCARSKMQVVQTTCGNRGTYHQWLQQARRDRVH